MKYLLIALLAVSFIKVSAQTTTSVSTDKTPTLTETTIILPTIQCGTCERKIRKTLKGVDGVNDVTISSKTKNAVVKFDAKKTSAAKLEDVITAVGYDANKKTRNMDAYNKLADCCKITAKQ